MEKMKKRKEGKPRRFSGCRLPTHAGEGKESSDENPPTPPSYPTITIR